MKIAIVNDLKLAVEALRRVVTSVPGYQVAWIAYDGAEAVSRCARDVPDVILMDLIMPVMDGVEATPGEQRGSKVNPAVVRSRKTRNRRHLYRGQHYPAAGHSRQMSRGGTA